ncbi:hypothetical protein GCM10010357_45850 [Streptomyces luteireticuli]|uniref:HTH cro/C1-type domain-containing protein n=1 Tax=Streptomyces luteireticuli TaxID=173858 RepID=A0ABN0YXU7_9ACTN
MPEELDPQVREFAEQLRRIVERSGLGIGAVADRTGYSKTSWERYLNGRLLPPRGAAEALAEATGTDVGHLGTLWELAERAWSRSELRHDVTMEAVRVAEAKAALGVTAAPEPTRLEGRAAVALGAEGVAAPPSPSPSPPPPAPAPARTDGDVDVRAKAIPMERPAARRPARRRHTVLLFTAGVLGTLLVTVSAVLLLGSGPTGARTPAPLAAVPPAGSPAAALPVGVGCTGGDCTGKDPEIMGCGGQHATTAGSATVGTSYLEVRYSDTCKAAWARMTQGTPGGILRVSTDRHSGAGRVERGTDGHSTMVAVSAPGEATACAVLSSGEQGCTVPRTSVEAP